MNVYYIPATVLDAWNRARNKTDKIPALIKLELYLEELDNEKTYTSYEKVISAIWNNKT